MLKLLIHIYWISLNLIAIYMTIITMKQIAPPIWVAPVVFSYTGIGLWITDYKYQKLLDKKINWRAKNETRQ